jgi:hypothetical protein
MLDVVGGNHHRSKIGRLAAIAACQTQGSSLWRSLREPTHTWAAGTGKLRHAHARDMASRNLA